MKRYIRLASRVSLLLYVKNQDRAPYCQSGPQVPIKN